MWLARWRIHLDVQGNELAIGRAFARIESAAQTDGQPRRARHDGTWVYRWPSGMLGAKVMVRCRLESKSGEMRHQASLAAFTCASAIYNQLTARAAT